MTRFLLLIVLVLLGVSPFCQTVGVVDYTDEVQDGYVLFAPTSIGDIYLIDECGHEINSWKTDGKAGLMGRLTPEGNLVYAKRVSSSIFNGGGIGGGLISFDWDGELLWEIELASPEFHQHHDFAFLPNGNILVNGWVHHTEAEALAKGREIVNANGVWSESILEIKITSKTDYEIVWQWNLWDHIIQEVDPTIDDYGSVALHPEKIDINFTNGASASTPDWLHVNSIDYNPDLDQILLNIRNFGEFIVIDHSTTTEEAAGSVGGLASKGGDILYRWGNAFSYQQDAQENRSLFGQHDAHWIEKGLLDAGKILVFNNGLARPDGNYSTVDLVNPPLEGFNYVMEVNKYGPNSSANVYGEPSPSEQYFFSSRISGSQRLRNGNTLICHGRKGIFMEVNSQDEIVWKYINPVGVIISAQGDDPNTSNNVFQAIKYYKDFEGFENKDLSPGEKLELNPTDSCNLVAIDDPELEDNNWVKNNYVVDELIVNNPDKKNIETFIYTADGRIVTSVRSENDEILIPMQELSAGIYFAVIVVENQLVKSVKIQRAYE